VVSEKIWLEGQNEFSLWQDAEKAVFSGKICLAFNPRFGRFSFWLDVEDDATDEPLRCLREDLREREGLREVDFFFFRDDRTPRC